ncbi:MAG: hypothetical protein H6513_08200 [Acidimicrobiaceae bacterium]|nr:hypothetical protein [Ilumatobacter sp.]MCB9380658.1 hypothetical protein [Acidimicrobiaceae bacterium]MCO5329144.1 hypothetical protein [Ilumatobacteraceae bacterium]
MQRCARRGVDGRSLTEVARVGAVALVASFLAIVAVTLGPLPVGAGSPEVVACSAGQLSAAQLNSVFASPGVGGGAGYAGGDYQHVYPLPDGRFLWLFQDVFFSADDDLRDSLTAAAHNAGLVQQGNCWSVLGGPNMQNYIGSSLTTPLRHWFWPLDGDIGADGALWVFMVEMSNPRGTGADYGAVPVGTWVARIDTTTLAVLSFTPAPDAGTRLFGWSITSDDTYSYLYGHCYRQFVHNVNSVAQFDATCMPHTYLARVPKGRFDLTPEYWIGGTWGSAASARPLMTRGAANPMDVERFGDTYVSVTKIDDWWGAWVYVDKAPNPWGPWENDQARFIVNERKCSQCGIYHAHLMPYLDQGALVVSWSNGGPFNLWQANAFLYRPSFVTMPLPTFRADAPVAGLHLQPRTPVRAIDTRVTHQRMTGGSMLTVPLAGYAAAGAVGVVATLTAVDPARTGYLTAWPCGARMPWASVLNTTAGRNTPNGVHVRIDPQQRLCIYSSVDTDVIVDVTGSYLPSATAGLHVVPATRVADTRGGTPLAKAAVLQAQVGGVAGVPGAPAAVTVTVSAVAPAGKGWLTVWPCGQAMPLASTVNFYAGDEVANSATVPLGPGGLLCVYTSAVTHVVVDVAGWWDAAGLPARMDDAVRALETRTGPRPPAGATVGVDLTGLVPGGTSAVIANVTTVQPGATGPVVAWDCAAAGDGLTTVAGTSMNRAALAAVALGDAGDGAGVCLTTSVPSHLLVDVMVTF